MYIYVYNRLKKIHHRQGIKQIIRLRIIRSLLCLFQLGSIRKFVRNMWLGSGKWLNRPRVSYLKVRRDSQDSDHLWPLASDHACGDDGGGGGGARCGSCGPLWHSRWEASASHTRGTHLDNRQVAVVADPLCRHWLLVYVLHPKLSRSNW